MKQFRLFFSLFIGFLAFNSLQAQTSFFENFNGGNALNNWTLIDVDNRTPAAPVAYVTDAWVVRQDFDTTGVGDSVAVSTSWYSPAGASDDYMITPMIITTANPVLEYDAKAQDPSFPDGYELRISTTSPDVAGLMMNPPLFTTTAENATWIRRSINLSAYANDTIYLAWRNNSNDQFLLLIDNVKVFEPASDDAELSGINVASTVTNGSLQTIGGTIVNRGANNLTSVMINWSVNNGTTNTDTLSLNLSPNSTVGFSHSINWTPGNAGNISNLRVWTSMPNGNLDGNTANDTIAQGVFVNLGNTVQKNVLFEEFTTAVCQFCPDGHVIQDQIVASIPSVIPVGVHACFNTDAMTVAEASQLCTTLGINSAPTAMVDRKLYDGNNAVAFGRANNAWGIACSTQTAAGSAVDIVMTGTYNNSNRQIDVDVDVNFVDYVLPGDIRVSLMLLEDSMSGTGNGWAQYNAYYAVNGHPFFGVGTPFPAPNNNISFINGYQHRHVLRDIWPTSPSTWGDATTVPSNYQLNTTYSRNFLQSLSTATDENQAYLVAVVSYFGGNNIDQYEVINAKQIKLNNLTTALQEENALLSGLEVYPNPTDLPYTNLSFKLEENSNVQARIMDLTGKVVHFEDYGQMTSGNQLIQLNTSRLENGFYFVNLKAGEEEVSRKISVLR